MPVAGPATPPVARRLAERLRPGTVGSGSGGLRAIGALTRAATVSEELSLKLDFTKLDADFLKVASAPVFQRLDYLLNRPYGTDTLLCRK